MSNSVITPAGVTRAILLPLLTAYQTFPSGPAEIASDSMKSDRVGNIVKTPAGVDERLGTGHGNRLLRHAMEFHGLELLRVVPDRHEIGGHAQVTTRVLNVLDGAVLVVSAVEGVQPQTPLLFRALQRLNVPIVGIVENMSTFVCPHCNQATAIFGDAGGQKLAEEYGVPLLARLPLDPETRVGGDEGQPITVRRPDSAPARAFRELAVTVNQRLDALGQLGTLPKIS